MDPDHGELFTPHAEHGTGLGKPGAEGRASDLATALLGHQLRDARIWIEVWIYPQRVQETDRGVERVLSSFLNGDGSKSQQPPPISTGIANLLNELGLHGRIPRLFCALTFENISLLRSRLACFLPEYEMAPDAAVALPQVSSSPHRFRTKIP